MQRKETKLVEVIHLDRERKIVVFYFLTEDGKRGNQSALKITDFELMIQPGAEYAVLNSEFYCRALIMSNP